MSIKESLQERILILDGAMGTMIQSLCLPDQTFHRGKFYDWQQSLVGNNEVLNLTAPEVVGSIHRRYINAGADIITANTFSANRISQREYGCEELVGEMAAAGARIARQAADECTTRKIWVAGTMGPTSKSLSLASDMNSPASRAVCFDEMVSAYFEQAQALIEGGADLLMLETCFDALNAKAALYAIQQLNEKLNRVLPVMVSVTINDRSGRTLTGQTLEAFYISISHYPILSFGLNCSFGVTELRRFVEQLSATTPAFISLHPNAGLPNEMGEYEELPDFTATHLGEMAKAGLLNIAGGCCGTNDNHIRAIAHALKGISPRQVPKADTRMKVSGLEPLLIDKQTTNFINVGERTNVAGSRKFARLIAEKKYDEAMSVARNQIDGGASVIDINMDDAMLDSRQEMQTFVRYTSNDPAIARSVLMIDSSDWPTVIEGLKNAQGKCIVNSISLKGGEHDFLTKAREVHRLGAAVVVMAFDEEGQATTYDRKIAIARRAYDLLTGIGFPAQDIVFDVNILSIGTGIKEHSDYGRDFIKAVKWIKDNLPYCKTSGGVSNLSFAFRGNNTVREAMHSAFLYHAIRSGLDMAIVNPAMLQVYDEIEPHLLKAVEDVILNVDEGATDRLLALADQLRQEGEGATTNFTNFAKKGERDNDTTLWQAKTIEERLSEALVKGDNSHLADDIPEAVEAYNGNAVEVIEKPLMQAMEHIGQRFGEGKMFLPQVVKSAKVMREAVALLQPYIKESKSNHDESPLVIMATADGDVHDIGKNIVNIVLNCNNFTVHDLGVMVPNEVILEETKRLKPCLVGVSGLITPSLKVMENLCRLFQRNGMDVPLLVGGATTSAVHTAVKLAPLYDGCVVYGGDASQTSVLAKKLQMNREETIRQIKAEQQLIRETYEERHTELIAYKEANQKAPLLSFDAPCPTIEELTEKIPGKNINVADMVSYIDWRMFLLFWGFKGETLQQLLVNPEAEKTLAEGKQWLDEAITDGRLQLQQCLRFEPVKKRDNDLVFSDGTVMPMLRSQSKAGNYLSLADFFHEQTERPIGLFTIVARDVRAKGDENKPENLMSHAIRARLAEATAERLHSHIFGRHHAIRAAFGYPSCPDHSLKRIVIDRLQARQQLGIELTDHYSILPSTAICGLFIVHPDARYFPVGRIDREQLEDYCHRRSISLDEGELLLSKYITKTS